MGRPVGARGSRKREERDDDRCADDAIEGGWPKHRLEKMNDKFAEAIAREVREVRSPTPPLKRLSGQQLRTVLEAAALLRSRAREPFYQIVSDALISCGDVIGDGDLDRAIKRAMTALHVDRVVRV